MTPNPLYNALLASGYIVLIVTIMTFFVDKAGPERGILVPLTILSLFVLSAAVMGFIFFYHPIQLYLEGKQKEAVNLFLKTVGFFAGITVLLLATLFATAA